MDLIAVRRMPALSRPFVRCMECRRPIALGSGGTVTTEFELRTGAVVYGIAHDVCPDRQAQLGADYLLGAASE